MLARSPFSLNLLAAQKQVFRYSFPFPPDETHEPLKEISTVAHKNFRLFLNPSPRLESSVSGPSSLSFAGSLSVDSRPMREPYRYTT
jgi:hypothetical protein